MSNDHHIRYLLQHEIDKEKWDSTINDAPGGLIYNQSFYLDSLCNWNALVLGDYDYIMPLPLRKKAWITYCFTPAFAAQLGITGKDTASADIVTGFIRAIPRHIAYIDLQLNEYNEMPAIKLYRQRTNLILPLQDPYQDIYNRYTKNAKKNIRQSNNRHLVQVENIDISTVIQMYRRAYGKLSMYSEKDYTGFYSLMQKAIQLGKGFTAGVMDDGGNILAAVFFAIDHRRIYYLLGAPTQEGRKSNAVYFLIDKIIEKYAGADLIFDFEGSDIASVASFYLQFGPAKTTYPHLLINRLPTLLKWLKK